MTKCSECEFVRLRTGYSDRYVCTKWNNTTPKDGFCSHTTKNKPLKTVKCKDCMWLNKENDKYICYKWHKETVKDNFCSGGSSKSMEIKYY